MSRVGGALAGERRVVTALSCDVVGSTSIADLVNMIYGFPTFHAPWGRRWVAGLSALIAASATAFTAVKLAGAAYLVFLGVQTLMGRGDTGMLSGVHGAASSRRVFWQGFMVNLLNPKTAIFFLAFVPQFVDPAIGSPAIQTLVLGAVFIAAGLLSDSAYALAAGGLGSRVLRSPWWRRSSRWVSGSVYLGLGLTTALGSGDSN